MSTRVTPAVNDVDGNARSGSAYAAALLVSIALVLWLFPPSFLAGKGLFFFDGAILGDISAWLYFAHDVWQLPLLYTPWLNYPEGANIGLTNSIPLMALLFKPIAAILPDSFHYFGFWHAIVLVAQALAAVFLLRSLGVRSVWGAALAAAFALLWPGLLGQFGQPALMAHAVILFALGCYFHGFNARWTPSFTATMLIGTCQLALLIHPYLAVLCYAVLIAFLIDEGRRTRLWGTQLATLVIALVITAGFVALLGIWGVLAPVSSYGSHALSVDALWCSGSTLRKYGCNPGEYATDGYLGLGGLVLLACTILLSAPRGFGLRALRAHAGLTLVAILLALFAFTHQIHWGSQVVRTFDLPAWLESSFDSLAYSSRFFWPVGYVLLFGSLAVLLRYRYVGPIIVTVALALQAYDTLDASQEIRVAARASEKPLVRTPARRPMAADFTAHAALPEHPDTTPDGSLIPEQHTAATSEIPPRPAHTTNTDATSPVHSSSGAPSGKVSPGEQLFDPLLTGGTFPAHAPTSDPATSATWADALRGIAHVTLFPAYGCMDADPLVYLPVQYLAARAGATFNTVYGARSNLRCDEKHARLNQDIPPGTLVLAPASLPGQALPAGIRLAVQHGQCGKLAVMPVQAGVAQPQLLLACRAEPVDEWVQTRSLPSPQAKVPVPPAG